MTERSVIHASFTIERTYDATPARVFAAFANPKEKARWFSGPPEWETTKVAMDFRVGGLEVNDGGPKGGPLSQFEGRYMDIVPNERIVYAYDMHLDDKRISCSLTTVELKQAGDGTRLTFTEHGAFLDGYDNPAGREEGTAQALDALGASLRPLA